MRETDPSLSWKSFTEFVSARNMRQNVFNHVRFFNTGELFIETIATEEEPFMIDPEQV